MTLVEFLLARIEEDEALAKAGFEPYQVGGGQGVWTVVPDGRWEAVEWQNVMMKGICEEVPKFGDREIAYEGVAHHEHIARWDPVRVLAECAAKRAIITHEDMWAESDGVLRLLAAPYADHPDFDQAWSAE